MGDRASTVLEVLRTRLVHNSTAIMAVLRLVLGAKILADGFSRF